MRRTVATIAATLTTGAIGVFIGTTLTEPDVVTRTETVEVATVPDSCLTALDHADESLDLSAEGFVILAGGFDAASRFDLDGVEQTARDMRDLNPLMGDASAAFRSARDECRAAS